VMRRKLLHLGCVVGKSPDFTLSKWSDETESRGGQMHGRLISKVPRGGDQLVPSIEFINTLRRVGREDANDVGEQCLPHPKLNLVQ